MPPRRRKATAGTSAPPPDFFASDPRRRVLDALAGGHSTHDPFGFGQMGLGMLPAKLDLAEGAKRLLDALGKADPSAHRRILSTAAEGLGLALLKPDPPGTASSRLKGLLASADEAAKAARAWVERVERQTDVFVVRSVDPGARDPAGCCERCGTPLLLSVTLKRLVDGWTAAILPS